MDLSKTVRFKNQYFQYENGQFTEISKQEIIRAHGLSAPTLITVVNESPIVSNVSDKPKNSNREWLVKLKRPELNQIALHLGINPNDFKNNFSLIKAIQEAQNK